MSITPDEVPPYGKTPTIGAVARDAAQPEGAHTMNAPIHLTADDHAEVAARVRDRLAESPPTTDQITPGCPNGSQGWHLYDPEEEGQPLVTCMNCGVSKSEVQILAELAIHEPPPGSVVLREGIQGTAWQRFYGSGAWKSPTGKTLTWDALLSRSRPNSRVWLIYVPHRPRS